MAMNKTTFANSFYSWITTEYPDMGLTEADVKDILEKFMELIITEILNADITVTVDTISITNPLGLVATTYPVTGAAPDAGSGSGTATITA
jgi:hypothetical protein